MPTIDVTDIVLDPDFSEPVTIVRRHETINTYGESVVDSVEIPIQAVVTSGPKPGMERMPEGQLQTDIINVHCQQRLVGPSNGNQPDIVIWRGRQFVVTKVNDYSHFGRGFVSAECSSMDYLDSVT